MVHCNIDRKPPQDVVTASNLIGTNDTYSIRRCTIRARWLCGRAAGASHRMIA
jgi:hypothetical protein